MTDRGGASVIRLEVESGEVEPFAMDLKTEPPLPVHVLPIPLARDARGRLLLVAGDRLLVGPAEGKGRKKEKSRTRHEREGKDERAGEHAFRSYRLVDGDRPARGITSIAVGRNGDLFVCDVGARRILRVAVPELNGDARE